MPSSEQNRKAGQAAVESGNLVRVKPDPLPASDAKPVPVATYPAAPNSILRTPLPAIHVQQPDMQREWQTGATPQQRIPPTSPTSSPIFGAQAASQSIIVRQSLAGLILKTNNVNNNYQGVLNLISGTNVTLSADSQGGVTIGAFGGDGLVHGDTIWESDSAYLLIRDDFNGGNSTTGSIGEIGWSSGAINPGAAFPVRGVGPLPGCGAFKIANSSTAEGFQNLNLCPPAPTGVSGADAFIPLFDYPVGWKATFVFMLSYGDQDSQAPTTAAKSIYIGLAAGYKPNTAANTWPVRPNIFYGLRYDTSTTAPAISDATFKFEVVNNVSNSTTQTTRNNTQGTVVNTGVTPAIGVPYRLEILMVAAGVITMSLNGSAPQTFTVSAMTAGGAGANGSVSLATNVARVLIGPTTAQTDQDIFVGGSKVVITNTGQGLDGTFTLLTTTFGGPSSKYLFTHVNIGNVAAGSMTMVGFPAVTPIFSFGNDNQATPTANNLSLLCDFFSLIWNPGVGGGTGTPVATKSRYW